MERWRVIDSGALSGAQNMAIDEAIAAYNAEKNALPTLRLYAWDPYAISLGFHQSFQDIHLDRCRQDGIQVVVRPTGGRAVLHAEELTYAVVIPKSSAFYHDQILAVYETISRALLEAFHQLDISADFERAARTPKNFSRGELSSLCYASSVQHEIGVGGRKLVGSAQRHIDGVILQHGSILIGPKHLDLTRYLNQGDDKWRNAVRRYMERHTACLNELSTEPVSYASLADAIRDGFESQLGIHLEPAPLTEWEQDEACQRQQPQRP